MYRKSMKLNQLNAVTKYCVDIAHRVSSRRALSYPNAIVCKFVRRLAKKRIMATRKQLSNVTPDQLGIEMAFPSSFRIRVFDHMTPRTQDKTRQDKTRQYFIHILFLHVFIKDE